MRFDMRRVDHLRVRRSSIASKLPEQIFPNAAPNAQNDCKSYCRTIFRPAIAPAATLQRVYYSVDNTAIIDPIDAPDIPRQVSFDPLPSLVA